MFVRRHNWGAILMVLAAIVVPVAGGTTGLTARLIDMMVTLVVVVVMV